MSEKNVTKKNVANQLVDNSTFKEVAKFLNNEKREVTNKKSVIDNILVMTHAAIVGDEINYIESGRNDVFLEDEDIKNLNETLNKKLSPLQYDKKIEDETILQEARKDIKEYILDYGKSFNKIFTDVEIEKFMEDEINMYLDESFKHYWKNIGGNPKPYGLYSAFDNFMNNRFRENTNNVFELYNEFYRKKNIIIDLDDVNKYKWLPILSHLVRSQYYITITTKEDVIYNPLNTRKRFSNGILNVALNSAENETYLIKNTRQNLLHEAFLLILKKAKYNKNDYFKSLIDLLETDKENMIKTINKIYREMSIINFMHNGEEKKHKEKILKKMTANFNNEYINYSKIEQSSEYVTKLSEEEKKRINAKDDKDNFGVGTILMLDNTSLINVLKYDFDNKFLK